MLSHQKLKVYGKGLAVVASLAEQRLPGLELLGRVVLMLRALSGSRSE